MRLFLGSDFHVDYRQNLDWLRALSRADFTDDVLIVGSGINSLVCAALLARSGRKVRVLSSKGLALRHGHIARKYVHGRLVAESRFLDQGLISDRTFERRQLTIGPIVLKLLRDGRQKDYRRAQEFQ